MDSAESARRAGRGLVSIAGAKVFFILTSYAVQLLLPRIFGEAKEFGLYSAAMSGVAIFNNVLIVATIQSVSKFVSEDEPSAPATLRQGLRLQTLVGGALAATLFVFAPAISRLLLDDQLTPLLRVASLVVFAYALYAATVGSLNGRHLFGKQAKLDMIFSVLRTTGILGGAAVGIGALGAVVGFAAAATSIVTVALIWVGWGRPGKRLPVTQWLAFMAPIWVYQVCLNGILMIDIQVLKRTATELALAGTATAQTAVDLANQYVAYYRAAQTFAFVPYQLIISMTFIIFPMISRATSLGDRKATQSTIQHAMRLSLILLLLVAAPISGAAHGVVRLVYPADYIAGAPALAVLIFGVAAFALFAVAATAISGAGRPSLAAGIAAFALVTVVVANRGLIVRAGLGPDTMRAAATGTAIGMVCALLIAAFAVRIRFGVFIPPLTWARAALAAAAGFFTAHAMPDETPFFAIVALVAGFIAALGTLVLTREITRTDWATVREVTRR
ncbi:MAG: lipopolysaccharide biosynthesis protein [Myxococcota bacterium]